MKIGSGCVIRTRNWGSEPFLIEIGDHVHVTVGVSFVTHDGGVWVFQQEIPEFDVFGRIRIGDNTYIGDHATILPGVTIGRNCVIGAGSVVSRSIRDNTVAAGNPIRFISTTDAYRAKMLRVNVGTNGMPLKAKIRALLGLPIDKEIKREPLLPG